MNEQKKPTAEAVRNWLKETGYPLEMRVFEAFRSLSFEVEQGRHVHVEYEGKSVAREIDVLAEFHRRGAGPPTDGEVQNQRGLCCGV